MRQAAPYLLVGWAAGLMAMGGHVQYVLYGWTLALVYGVCRAGMLRVPWPRALGGAIAAGAVALGLAAAQYLPLAELAGHSIRASGLGPWELADQAVRPQHLPLFVAPGFWGDFFRPGHTRPALAWEFVAYVGLLPLLLAAVGAAVAVRRGGGGVARFWLIVAIVALLGALGERFLVYRGLTLLPGWGSMRAPARLLSGYGLAVVALAGWGIEAVLARRWRWPALGVAAAAGYVMAVAAAAAVLPPKVEALAPGAGAASREALGLLLLFGTLALLWLQAAPRMALRTAAGSAVLLVLADVLLTGAALTPTADAAVYRLPTLGACRAAVPPGRGGGALAWYRPDTNLLTHQPNLFNMSPLSLRRPVELYDRAVEAGPRATANLLALLGVRVQVDDTGRLQPTPLTPRPMVWPAARVVAVEDTDAAVEWLAERAFAPGDAAVVAGEGPAAAGGRGRVSPAGGRALTFAERANRAYYNVESGGDAFWVINTTAYPGRSAWVDGRPAKLWRTNAVQVGVATGPGRHTIGVVFDSLTIRLGRFIFLMTLALSAGWLVVGRGRRD